MAGIELRLSEVVDRPDRRLHLAKRLRGFFGRSGGGGAVFGRVATLMAREAVAAVRAAWTDFREWRRPQPTVRQVVAGALPLAGARRVAMYVHYAPRAEVSEMVLFQLAAYRALGFAVVLLTMAPDLPGEAAMAQLRALCGLIVLRRNRGLDFGAWHDAVGLLGDLAGLEELLLVNDSLVGPVRPMAPLLAAMRARGAGVFGLTENLAPQVHLQSYFLLARGAAVASVLAFLAAYRITANKRLTIRRGEMGLTRAMRAAGHPVVACFGYERVEAGALATGTAMRRMRKLYASLLARRGDGAIGAALRNRPINATHGFWRELVEVFGFPFIKTDLLTKNPLGIADTMEWRELAEPEMVRMIERHLAVMRR